MFQEKNDNTYTAPVKQAEKSPKEKTMDANRLNSLATIDITQATTLEEQAIILQNNQDNEDSPHFYIDDVAIYKAKYQQRILDPEEPIKKEKKSESYISSYVGDYTSNLGKGIIANLGNDVAFVQKHLNRLGILSDKDYIAEKPATDKEIPKDTLPKTIEAIHWFQRNVLHYNTKYGYVIPGKGSINSLATITIKQKEEKYQQFLAKEKAEKERIAKEKAAAAKAAEIKRIKNEPATPENLKKHYQQAGSIEAFGKFLSDYAILNPNFVIKAYELMEFGEPDNLTRAIMYNLQDSEIAQLPDRVDNKFYQALDAGWTVDEEYALMKKLKKGRGIKYSNSEKENNAQFDGDAEKDLQTIREIIGYKMKGPVGKKDGAKNINDPEDVKQSAIQLKKKGYTVSNDSLKKGTCDQAFIDSLGKFQTDNNIVNGDKEPYYYMNANAGCYKKLFGSKGPFNSGLTNMYGHGTNKLNKKLGKEDVKLERLKRHLVYDKKANKSTGHFVESETISQSDYKKSIEKIGKAYGVKKDSNADKILDIVDKAVSNEDYYKAITQSVSAKLDLQAKSLGSNKVNELLAYRLERYHKLLVALGLFSGNMTGSACRKEETAHCWSIYYYWKTNHSNLSIVKSNIIKMYNKELKPDGKVSVDKSGSVKDLDGNIWAKKGHFNFDDKNKAKSLNSKWDTYMDKISQSRVSKEEDGTVIKDWRKEAAAEGYNYDNPKRYPMPLSGGMRRSKHITGDAIDINSHSFTRRNDAINDLIALRFGLIRPVGGEQWHFEITNVAFSKEEKKKTTTKE